MQKGGGWTQKKKQANKKELNGTATPVQIFIFFKNPPGSSATKARTCVGNE